jgi:putative glutamine amidotransferase
VSGHLSSNLIPNDLFPKNCTRHYTGCVPALIAIPEPSVDPEYNGRALPFYVQALEAAGAQALVVPLEEPQERVAKMLTRVQGILLPGSRFDVDPQRYGEQPIAACGPDDPARTAVDELLLQEGFNLRKPILAICHGTQTLNVWRNGSLIQDLQTAVNHQPGRTVVEAHPVEIRAGSRLAGLLAQSGTAPSGQVQTGRVEIGRAQTGADGVTQVNSSHHQAIRVPGDQLLVSAVSPGDGVIEAVELDAPEHFVVGVQWHPERTCAESALSRTLFQAFVREAEAWRPPRVAESVAESAAGPIAEPQGHSTIRR